MGINLRAILILGLSTALTTPAISYADYDVRCESYQYKYQSCRISEPGYVRIKRKTSHASCQQGKTWDFDSREIWVDDGCGAEFTVETNSHGAHDDKGAKIAAGAVVGLALLGALAQNADHADDHRYNDNHKYNDDDYYGSRHSSYVPKWMVGTFRGYNAMYGTEVTLTVDSDGAARGKAGDTTFKGYVNDEKLHFGAIVLDVDQTREGFVTSQTGDRENEVNYRRIY